MRALASLLLLTALTSAHAADGPGLPPTPPAPPQVDEREHREPGPALPRDADWAPERLLEGRLQYLPAAVRASRDASPTVRRGGLLILGMLGLPEGGPVARRALRDGDRLVRMQAGVTLALLYQPAGLPAATVCLREGPVWLRFYALYGLFRLDSAASRHALRDSRPALSGFLLATADRALQTRPRLRANTARSGQPNRALPIYQLWNDVSGEFVRESDMWWHRGDYDQCIRSQWTALYFDPGYVELFASIAWLQWSMGRHAEAISTYRRAIAANPTSWLAEQELGQYYTRHGHRQLGVRHLQRAADLGSPPVARRQLGHAYRDLGESEKARQVWQGILEMDPNDAIARRELDRMK
jgi:hypothetical protein